MAMREAFECGICLEKLSAPVVMECGHTFDRHCLEASAKKANDLSQATLCSLCRAPLNLEKLKPNYQLIDAICTAEKQENILNQQQGKVGHTLEKVLRELEELKKDNSLVKNSLNSVQIQLQSIQLENAVLKDRVTQLETKNEALESQLKSVTKERDDLQTTVNGYNSKVASTICDYFRLGTCRILGWEYISR